MLGLCAIWSPQAAAQNRSLPQVTIRMDRVPMSQIMSEIERQTKYLFVTGSDVKTDRITSLDVTAVARLGDDEVDGPFGGLEVHGHAVAGAEIAGGGKAILTPQVAVVGDMEAQGFHQGLLLMEAAFSRSM